MMMMMMMGRFMDLNVTWTCIISWQSLISIWGRWRIKVRVRVRVRFNMGAMENKGLNTTWATEN